MSGYHQYLQRRAIKNSGGCCCPKGDKGESAKGELGSKGQKGEQGVTGPTGPTGATGSKGPKGEQGVTGPKGPKGPKGEKGEQGVTGPTGSTGATGATGPKGPNGEQGVRGHKGQKGEVGITGPTGATGTAGQKGQKGEQGATGSTGAPGQKGEQGATGSTGATGTAGQKGQKGQKGEQGVTGATGQKGQKGEVGPQGTRGVRGFTGDKGAPFRIKYVVSEKNNVDSSGNLLHFKPQDVETGDFAIIAIANDSSYQYNSRLFVRNGAVWDFVSDLSGADGEDGLQGPKGSPGAPFQIKYILKNPGSDNVDTTTNELLPAYRPPDLKSGDFAMIDAPANETLNSRLYAWNEADNEWTFISDLSGEPGVAGPPGATGLQGPKGATGLRGSNGADGAQGPKGETGEIGLTGLKGDAGEKGRQGEIGITGQKGEKGDIGATGLTGLKGATGEKGHKGETGVTGLKGVKGEKGDIGATGLTGLKGATGQKGSAGEKGDLGATGLKGNTGEKGDIGITGPKGPAGVNALSNEIRNAGATTYIRIEDNSSNNGGNNDNIIQAFTNNSPALTIKDAKVGIGTSNPSIKLAIGDNDTGFDYSSDGNFGVKTNNGWRMYWNNQGNVGIGTSDPISKLSIMSADSSNGNSDEISFISQYNSADDRTGYIQKIGFYGKEEYTNSSKLTASIECLYGDNVHIPNFPGKSSSNLIFKTADKDTGDATERMRINHDGKISAKDSLEIGSLNDMYKGLTVFKDDVKMVIGNSGGGGNYGSIQVFSGLASNETPTSSSNTYHMLIQPNGGNVGIGTTNPAAKLDVNGNIKIEGLLKILGNSTPNTGVNGGAYFWNAAEIGSTIGGYNVVFNTGTATNGTERMRIRHDGNVGIGTTNPTAKLNVAGNTTITGRLDAYGGAYINGTIDHVPYSTGIHLGTISGQPHRIAAEFCGTDAPDSDVMIDFTIPGVDSLGRIYYQLAQDYMTFDTDATERLRIDSSGNVGIGTTTPTAKLDVNGNIKIGNSGHNGMIYVGDENWGMKISNPSTSHYYTDLRFHSGSWDNDNRRQFRVVDALHNEPKLVVSGNKGNVGIGTDNPRNKLEIIDDGASISLGDYSQGGFPGSRNIGVFDTGGAPGDPAAIIVAGMEIENTTLNGNYSQKLHFKTHRFAQSEDRRLTIDEYGNVGIGTENPSAQLDVQGNSTISGNVGIGTTTPDYKLDVQGYTNTTAVGVTWLRRHSPRVSYDGSGTDVNVAIRSTGSIWLSNSSSFNSYFLTSSDRRIKKEIEIVNDDEALNIINNLETVKYHYTSPAQQREFKTIGFIAQEVKEVLPNAVITQKEFLPDILELIENPVWDGNKLIYDIDVSGEEYTGRVLFKYQDGDKVKDIKVGSDLIFDKQHSKLYCYGREVNDFHTLDKNQIFALHHSGIQELSRKNIKLENKHALLETENNNLLKKTQTLEDKINNLEKLVHSLSEKLNQ